MSPAASPLVADTDDRVLPLFSGQGRSVTVPAHSKTRKERPPADVASETRSEEAERFQLTQYCDCGHWMHLAIFGLFLIVDSSKYMVDVRAIGHNPVTAQALVFLQDLISVLICVVAILRYIGPRGVVDTFCSAELFRCLPTAVLFSLSNAALAHAIGLGIGAATAVALGSLYMPMSALVSRFIFRRAYGWLELHALALLTFSSLTFCELRSRAIDLSDGIQGASFVVLYAALACAACVLAEHIFKQRHTSSDGQELYCVQKARFDFWGLLTSAVILLYLGASPSPSAFQDWRYLQVICVLIRVLQAWMAGVIVKHWSTVAKAVTQCLSMIIIFFLGDVIILGRSQGNVCIYMLALTVSLSAFMYQLGRRQTIKQMTEAAAGRAPDVENAPPASALGGRTRSDPTGSRSSNDLATLVATARSTGTEERVPPELQVCAPAEFSSLSRRQRLDSLLPRLPPVERLELLNRQFLEEERSAGNFQFVAWISSKKGLLIQLACVVVFVFFDSARTIANDQYISGRPIVSQSITFAQFGASIVVGVVLSAAVEGVDGLKAALSWKEILRCFPVATCFSLSQTFTIMAYSIGVSGMENTVVGNVYMPLSALLSRWIFRRSYSFLEWIALTVLMLSASAFVLLQNSASGSQTESIFNTGISYVLLSVVMSCLASMLSEKIMKAGNSHFYIQKVNLDVGSFFTSIIMLWVCGATSKRDQDAFWKQRPVDGRMESGIFVAWNWQMIIVLVVTLLQNWLAGFVAKRLSTVIRSSAQQLSLLIVYFVGDLLLNQKPFDWPVGTTALVIALSVQVFVFAGQAVKEQAARTGSSGS